MVITRVIDFPDARAKSFCIHDQNGDDNIYINARVSYYEQMKGFKHELLHVSRNDFEKYNVQSVESEAHVWQKQ